MNDALALSPNGGPARSIHIRWRDGDYDVGVIMSRADQQPFTLQEVDDIDQRAALGFDYINHINAMEERLVHLDPEWNATTEPPKDGCPFWGTVEKKGTNMAILMKYEREQYWYDEETDESGYRPIWVELDDISFSDEDYAHYYRREHILEWKPLVIPALSQQSEDTDAH